MARATDAYLSRVADPNIVVIFGDDSGYGDVGANGFGAETPHLDALAASGMRFTDMHAMSVCTPSRAALMTGRLGLRTGVVVNFWTDAVGGLPIGELTLAELLRDRAPVAYDRAMLGKWHLGTMPAFDQNGTRVRKGGCGRCGATSQARATMRCADRPVPPDWPGFPVVRRRALLCGHG